MKTVFIDGQEGTTGLQISDRLSDRNDIELMVIPHDKRKDVGTKAGLLNEADLAILCLPDAAARQSVELITNNGTKVIDASTAHRTTSGWIYGLPELNAGQRHAIKSSRRVSNPGCYATAFILALQPLVAQEILPGNYPVTINAVSGYSGGGKKLIQAYQAPGAMGEESLSHRPYALGLQHKHIPEMQRWAGLEHAPVFSPAVGNFYSGMLVAVPLLTRLLSKDVATSDIRDTLAAYYADEPFVRIMPLDSEDYLDDGFLSATGCNGTNRIDIFIFGGSDQMLLVARLDNLGKGASGAAIQNMNIMLGFEETAGLPAAWNEPLD